MRSGRGLRMAAATIVSGAALALSHAGVAQALDPEIVWDGPVTQTIHYGNPWGFSATVHDVDGILGPWTSTSAFSGAPSGWRAGQSVSQTDGQTSTVYIGPEHGQPVLEVGEYTATLTMIDASGVEHVAPSPVELIVVPAAIGLEVRIAADPTNPRNAIVTTLFTGDDLEYLDDPSFDPLSPAGTLTVEVADSAGDVAETFTTTRDADQTVVASSFYWLDVPAGEYAATASFASTGEGAANFEVSRSAPAELRAPGPHPGSTAAADPAGVTEEQRIGPMVPLWVPLVLGVGAVGLAALVVVEAVWLSRLRRPVVRPDEDSG